MIYAAKVQLFCDMAKINHTIFTQKFASIEKKHYLCRPLVNDRLMTEENTIEIEILGEELGLLVAEDRVRDIDALLEDLLIERGANFIKTLKEIANHPSFYPVKDGVNIYSTGGENGDDYDNLLNAARRAVEHSYKVYILPNPNGFRTADFIFERKGVYKMFDLKTIHGKNIVGNRLIESIGQTNRVLLNIPQYNTRKLVHDIRKYFIAYDDAIEILIFKGKAEISISRRFALNPRFYFEFKKIFEK